MNKLALAGLLVLASIAGAHAFGMGKLGFQFGRAGSPGGKGQPTVQPTGKILLIDGTSFLLKLDGTSKLCRVGGC